MLKEMRRYVRSLGFTLVEVMVAMLILAIGLLGLAGITVVVLRSNTLSQQISQATALASSLLESLRANSSLTNCTQSIADPCDILSETGIWGKGEAYRPAPSNFVTNNTNSCAINGVLAPDSTTETMDAVSADGTSRSQYSAGTTLCQISSPPSGTPFIRYYKVTAISGSTERRLVAVVLFRDKFNKWRAVTLDTRQAN